jgi:hypothetical protein
MSIRVAHRPTHRRSRVRIFLLNLFRQNQVGLDLFSLWYEHGYRNSEEKSCSSVDIRVRTWINRLRTDRNCTLRDNTNMDRGCRVHVRTVFICRNRHCPCRHRDKTVLIPALKIEGAGPPVTTKILHPAMCERGLSAKQRYTFAALSQVMVTAVR